MTPTSNTTDTILTHIESARYAGTLEAVALIADELASVLRADPDRVKSRLHRDRSEWQEIQRRIREPGSDIALDHLDERTVEALDALEGTA